MATFIKNNCDCCPPSVCEPCDVCAATQGTGTLYFNAVTYDWNYLGNWWQDAAATIPALAVPWVPYFYNPVCIAYYHYNLTSATGNTGFVPPYNFYNVISGGGICDLYQVVNEGIITSGTFTGDRFRNEVRIDGGTFTGDDFVNEGSIYGGTFSGNGFANTGGYTFDGVHFFHRGEITGGTWAGSGFVNHTPYNSEYDGYVCAPSWPVQTC